MPLQIHEIALSFKGEQHTLALMASMVLSTGGRLKPKACGIVCTCIRSGFERLQTKVDAPAVRCVRCEYVVQMTPP